MKKGVNEYETIACGNGVQNDFVWKSWFGLSKELEKGILEKIAKIPK